MTCKLVAGLQATSIFVSTISITAIALDRYKVIVKPGTGPCHPVNTVLTLSMIWFVSLLLSGPLFIYRTVESHKIGEIKVILIRARTRLWMRLPIGRAIPVAIE